MTVDSNATDIVHLGSVSLTGGAKLLQVAAGQQPLVVEIANGGTFFIDSSSEYDVGSNDLVISNGSLAGLAAAVGTGYAEGSWTGNGITSSTAAADSRHLTAVGIIPNSVNGHTPIYTTFDADTSAAATDVLIKYTFYGDANLSGKVDGSDYSLTDAGYSADAARPQSANGWYNGNFNYDAAIDGSDYSLIDNAFDNQVLGSVPAAVADSEIATDETAAASSMTVGPVTVRPIAGRSVPGESAGFFGTTVIVANHPVVFDHEPLLGRATASASTGESVASKGPGAVAIPTSLPWRVRRLPRDSNLDGIDQNDRDFF